MKNLLLILFSSLLLISQSFNVLSCDCPLCPYSPQCQQEEVSKPCSLCRNVDCDACDGFNYNVEALAISSPESKMLCKNGVFSYDIDLFNHLCLPDIVPKFRRSFDDLISCYDQDPRAPYSTLKSYQIIILPGVQCSAHKDQCKKKKRFWRPRSKCVSTEGIKLKIDIEFKIRLSENKKGLRLQVESCTCADSLKPFKCTFKNKRSEIEIPVDSRELMIHLSFDDAPQTPKALSPIPEELPQISEELFMDCPRVSDQENVALIALAALDERKTFDALSVETDFLEVQHDNDEPIKSQDNLDALVPNRT